MEALSGPMPYRSRGVLTVLFVLGVVMLIGTWTALYLGEALFTESHLVGYYCCVTEQELPAPGSLERTMSDFFRTLPGKHLPSLIFVGVNMCLFAICMRRGGKNTWWLPFLFVAFNTLYLLVDFELMVASWSISDRLLGPQTSVYKGYGRTWYGIVLHLLLWGAYLLTLSAAISWLMPKVRSMRGANGPRDSLLE
ncbi:MAG: hypothetical protein PVF77_15630 [Anaerolineae bacterium]